MLLREFDQKRHKKKSNLLVVQIIIQRRRINQHYTWAPSGCFELHRHHNNRQTDTSTSMSKLTGAKCIDINFHLFVLLHKCSNYSSALNQFGYTGVATNVWRNHIHWNDNDIESALPYAACRDTIQTSI